MIIATNISKSFGTQILLDNVSFNINSGEKIGLVGRNGTGKSTLFKMILGEEHPDAGDISVPKGYTLGCLEQHIKFTKPTVLEEASKNLKNLDEQWMVEKILSGLGFSSDDMERNPAEFSGGFQIRINLAKVLSSDPDLLMLDEPGNYLDVISIRWLSKFLREWKNELILITHDRGFMDSVITHTIGIHRNGIRKIAGNTEKFYEQIILDEEIYEKTRLNDEKKRKDVEQFIERFRAKASLATRVKSKEKMLQKQSRKERLVDIKDLDFQFKYDKIEPKVVMEIENLSFSYDGKNFLFKDLNVKIEKDDRIAIIGKNGKGKTTLLKVITGKLPQNTGTVKKHSAAKIGYFEQTNIQLLDDRNTVEEEIDCSITDRSTYRARNIAGLMMFEGDSALKKIKSLSGGEKSRVLLGKLLCSPSNILLLDEPTNHFDMQSCDSILEAIDSYPGAVIIATHNEMFLHAIPNKLIVFDKEKIVVFDGCYQDFLEKIGWGSEDDVKVSKKESSNNKEIRKLRADIIAEKSKKLKPVENKIKSLENSISEKEKELSDTNAAFEKATQSGIGSTIQELSITITELEVKINTLYEELEAITVLYDNEVKIFDERLNDVKG
ncbi:MAG: ABC transporter ATP-binding protein [Spirochaetes bacterium GWF1_31_7]|nr:MAG: ABC transporter ATP-binding protein [Spirochaetes bacterium GWE1_32_154]OHD49056.1 MAG: ABC transporter ATP-binding protein [Spirochaetes bacterium GWF1_31_7]OHD50360.1 MAG: ABC transporter ATP-binding protein [Spirochaetes bacterium GWE2_31_10]HBD93852.1 ABC transporter ATP-binding protein [Spirochaetia bacterium]HBI38841.1 ABC transporter ATP-binding protein [Spirochaetia bacterium]